MRTSLKILSCEDVEVAGLISDEHCPDCHHHYDKSEVWGKFIKATDGSYIFSSPEGLFIVRVCCRQHILLEKKFSPGVFGQLMRKKIQHQAYFYKNISSLFNND